MKPTIKRYFNDSLTYNFEKLGVHVLQDRMDAYYPLAHTLKCNAIESFLSKATKYIFDAKDIYDWMHKETKLDQEVWLPFEHVWFEFHKGYGIQMPDMNGGMIVSVGIDLRLDKLISYFHDKHGEMSFDICSASGAGQISNAGTLARSILSFLKIEHINAVSVNKRNAMNLRLPPPITEVKDVIYIYRKQPKQKNHHHTPESIITPIDWSHRWEVAGHWRKIKGKGKDQNGNEVEGKTWVRDCVKGPENKPLKKKIRVVRDRLPPDYREAPRLYGN